MARKRSTKIDSVLHPIAGLIGLYFLWIVALYFSDRAAYWRQLGYFLVVVALAIGGMFAGSWWVEHRHRTHEEGLLAAVRQNELEDSIKSFIDSFGLEKKRGDIWEYRGFTFDWNRLRDFIKVLNEKGMHLSTDHWEDISFLLHHYIEEKEERFTRDSMSTLPSARHRYSDLSGQEFERLLARLYEAMGYSVEQTGKTGDQGGDLVVNMTGQRVLIQAKRYVGSVGNAAVQEAAAAQNFYNCGRAMVVTSGEFTKEAYALAKANDVELISKDRLSELLLQYLKESWG